jgi:hypothetical protein
MGVLFYLRTLFLHILTGKKSGAAFSDGTTKKLF